MNPLKTIFPKNELGDFLYSLCRFIQFHRRLPKKNSLLFNDPYFFMKISSELDKPLRTFTSDKEFLKIFVKSVVGDQYNVDTLAIIRSLDELNKFKFPARCYIKATHGSGWSHLRRNGEEIPLETFQSWLRSNYYFVERERNYKNLDPKIIVEPLAFDSESSCDYKAFCHKGKFKLMAVIFDRNNENRRAFFDREWKSIDVKMVGSKTATSIPKPACFPEMIRIAEEIASFFDLIRIDFYTNGDQILIGELTHCVGSALSQFESVEEEKLKGSMIFE